MRRRGPLTAALIVGVAAILAIALVVVAHDHSRDRRRASARAVHAYLAELRPIAQDVYAAVQPVQSVIDAVNAVRPPWYAVYAARDVFAHADTRALARAADALQALSAPPSERKALARMVSDVKQFQQAISAGPKRAHDDDINDLYVWETTSYPALFSEPESDWYATLHDVYAVAHENVPPLVSSSADASTKGTAPAWVFAADEACLVAADKVYPALDRLDKHPKSAADIRAVADAFRRVSEKLDSLPRTAADAATLRQDIDLSVVDGLADALDSLATAAANGDDAAASSAVDQLDALGTSVDTVGSALSRHGAVACGNLVEDTAGTSQTSGSPSA